MSANPHFIKSFRSYNKAIKALRKLEKSGGDISSLSIIGADWRTHERTAKNRSKGDMLEIGTTPVLISGDEPLHLQTASFYCVDVGGMVMAGPMSKWALTLFTGDDPQESGLYALHDGLSEMGVSQSDIEACQAAIRQGRLLVVVPGQNRERRRPAAEPEPVIRISDVSKYS